MEVMNIREANDKDIKAKNSGLLVHLVAALVPS